LKVVRYAIVSGVLDVVLLVIHKMVEYKDIYRFISLT